MCPRVLWITTDCPQQMNLELEGAILESFDSLGAEACGGAFQRRGRRRCK